MKSMPAGSIQDFSEAKAAKWVEGGAAEYVDEDPQEVKDSPKEPETAEVKTKFEGRQKRTRKK